MEEDFLIAWAWHVGVGVCLLLATVAHAQLLLILLAQVRLWGVGGEEQGGGFVIRLNR